MSLADVVMLDALYAHAAAHMSDEAYDRAADNAPRSHVFHLATDEPTTDPETMRHIMAADVADKLRYWAGIVNGLDTAARDAQLYRDANLGLDPL